jgi:hypothetical protein
MKTKMHVTTVNIILQSHIYIEGEKDQYFEESYGKKLHKPKIQLGGEQDLPHFSVVYEYT